MNELTHKIEISHKMLQFFSGEDYAKHGDDARLEMTPAELIQISNIMADNTIMQTKMDFMEKEATRYCPKFRNQQEKHMVFHTITAIEKCLNIIGNDDAIDDISILKDLIRKIDVEE